MYRLININELEEELALGSGKWLIIDVPDITSVTGFTSKKINLASVSDNIGSLSEVLGVGNTTGANSIIIEDTSSLIFNNGIYTANITPSTLSTDIDLKLPTEEGTLGLELDLPEKTINVFNGSFGLANTGNSAYRPKIKITNRKVFIYGTYILPLATDSTGSTLDTNGAGYVTKYLGRIYTGSSGGYTLRVYNDIISQYPLLPSALYPSSPVTLNNKVLTRTINLNGRMKVNTIVPSVQFLNNGTLYFQSVEADERNGLTTSAFTKNNNLRYIISKYENGDSIMNFDNYFNSFDSAGTTDKRILTDTGVNYNHDLDLTSGEYFGGLTFRFNISYQLPNTTTLQQIESAYNSI